MKQKTYAELAEENRELRKERDGLIEMHENCQRKNININQDIPLLKSIIDFNPISIQIVDADGFMVKNNAAYQKLFEALPKSEHSIFKDCNLLELGFESRLRLLKRGKKAVLFEDHPYNAHLIDASYPDKKLWLYAIGFGILDDKGKPMNYVIIHVDITERVKAEQKIHDLNEKMQEEIEKEKKKISEQLHDNLGQELTGIKNCLENLKLFKQEAKALEMIETNYRRTVTLMDTIAKLTDDIRPIELDEFGIQTIIESYAEKKSKDHNLKINTQLDQSVELTEKAKQIVFAVVKECINNVIRHSKATQANICLKTEGEELVLIIKDNGIGIEKSMDESTKSVGLRIMKGRVRSLGGQCVISSEKNIGTQVKIRIHKTTCIL
jgi:signal transduction histidine kinase